MESSQLTDRIGTSWFSRGLWAHVVTLALPVLLALPAPPAPPEPPDSPEQTATLV
jgi:hypothetical protein